MNAEGVVLDAGNANLQSFDEVQVPVRMVLCQQPSRCWTNSHSSSVTYQKAANFMI